MCLVLLVLVTVVDREAQLVVELFARETWPGIYF